MKIEFDNTAQWLMMYLEVYGHLYRHHIIRTLCVKINNTLIPLGTTIRFDFDEITPSPEILWESESFVITETLATGFTQELIKRYTEALKIPHHKSEIKFPDPQERIPWRCTIANYQYWKAPMIEKTCSADLSTSWKIDLGTDFQLNERFADETSLHDKQSLQTYEIPGLFRDYSIDIDRDLKHCKISIVFPLVGRIAESFVSGPKLFINGTALVEIRDRLTLFSTIHWSDGSVTQEDREIEFQAESNLRIDTWQFEIDLTTDERSALTVYIGLSLDGGFQVDTTRHVVSVSPDAPINILSVLDRAYVGGEIFSNWRKSDSSVRKPVRQFEYYVLTVFNSIGLPTIWLGPHDPSGFDLISFDFSSSRVYLLECTSGVPRRKASLILQGKKRVGEHLPTKNLTTILVMSNSVSDVDRKDMGESDVYVIDGEGLVKMIELAEQGKRGFDILREVGVTESTSTW